MRSRNPTARPGGSGRLARRRANRVNGAARDRTRPCRLAAARRLTGPGLSRDLARPGAADAVRVLAGPGSLARPGRAGVIGGGPSRIPAGVSRADR
ncbi:hypothetical protein QLQ12_00530 [Actinoplanes sp. NEAU-A12]|uniref:Uncharacterized protein n=1 Tax=Actinoplanes sandaracinus TaxID=3045177 RepID=A0ABT6WBI3_9ACTN|nr:hypothetical protein [Actinoplanes sandaracinus]MDI6097093.1 hypothetical protein [Actinoplanes sandaracinus]